MTGTRILAFVEYASHVDRLRTLLSESAGERTISLDPKAEYALERAGCEFAVSDEYFTEMEIDRLGTDNYKHVEQFCDFVDEWLEKRLPVLKETGLHPARSNFLPLKMLFDAVTVRLLVLSAILREEQPKEVWYFSPRGTGYMEPHFLFFMDDSLYSLLIPLICSAWKIPAKPIDWDGTGELTTQAPPRQSWLERFLGRTGKTWRTVGDLRSYTAGWWRRLGKGNDSTLVMCDIDGDLQLLAQHLVAHTRLKLFGWSYQKDWAVGLCPFEISKFGGALLEGESLTLAAQARMLWSELFQQQALRAYLTWEGLDFSTVVESRLAHVVMVLLPKSIEVYRRASGLFAQCRPKMVLLSQVVLSWQYAIRAAAKACGMPVVTYQHGAFGYRESPMFHYSDSVGSDYILAYGRGVQRYLERVSPQGATPIAVGSPRLDQISKGSVRLRSHRLFRRLDLDPGKKTVVYCPTEVYGNRFYVTYTYPKSDSRYFHIQRTIVEAFRDFPSVQLIVNEHPGSQVPLKDFILDRQIANCRILRREIGFTELLPLADCFIIDSPTTTFLEALATGKPVFVFNNWFRWEEQALELVKRCAVFRDDLDAFCHVLRDYLKGLPIGEGNERPSEFLEQYGTCLSDGRSLERAASAIESILENRVRVSRHVR